MYILRTQQCSRVNDNPLDYFPHCISNKNFISVTLLELFPENVTIVTVFGKVGMIVTFSSMFALKMVLVPIFLFLTRSPYPTFGHIYVLF